MTDLFLRICCCKGEEEDGPPYSPLDNHVGNVTPVRQRIDNSSRLPSDLVNDSHANGHSSSLEPPRSRNRQEIEEDLLNQILDETQHDIIDVSHLDGMTLSTTEFVQRSREYESAVVAHDQRLRRGTQATASSPPSQGLLSKAGPLSTSRGLLDDVGNRAADWLSRPLPSQEALQASASRLEEISSAVKDEMKIQHKQELVVYMDG